MINFTFSEDFSELNSNKYLDVYKSQNLIHQDYFHHPKFQHACISVFSNYTKCYLLSVYTNDKLIGYAAFRIKSLILRKINYEFLVPVSFSVAEYNYPIIDKKFISEFFSVLDDALTNYNVYFQHTPSFFKNRIIDSVKKSYVRNVIDNPVLINLDDDILKASNKKGLIRDYKSLNKEFAIETQHLTDNVPDEILDKFFELHIKRRANSNFNTKEYQDLYRKLSNLNIDSIGSSILSLIKAADGNILAMHFGFISKNRFIYQIPAYNLEYKSKSPGTILFLKILEYSAKKNTDILDLGVGLEPYKFRFMNKIETYFNITKFKNPLSNVIQRINFK